MNIKRSIKKRINKFFSPKCNFDNYYKSIPESFEFPTFKNPTVSIVIPVYNQYKYTKALLWSILKNSNMSKKSFITYEIIIGDDNSTDETRCMENIIKGIKIIHNTKSLGFLKNTNTAAKLATGKYIILLNNDIITIKNWLEPLVNAIENDSTIGIAAGRYLFPDGTHQEAGAKILPNGTTYRYGYNQYEINKEYSYTKEVDYCSGCGILFRRTDWEKLNGFDESYSPAYYEDVDFAMRMKYELGLKTIYKPESKIFHFCGKSYGEKAIEISKKNREKFMKKWGEKIKNYSPL